MIKSVLALLIGLSTTTAAVDRIEGNLAVIDVGREIITVPVEEFNNSISEGDHLTTSKAIGRFEWFDGNDWYQFKSYDNTVWWALTTEELGFVPEANKTYVLTYYDNGTTDCAEELESIYDDIFLGAEELR